MTHNEGSGIYFLRYAKGQESKEKNKKIKQGYLANSRATSEFTITNSLKSPYRIVTIIQKDYSGSDGLKAPITCLCWIWLVFGILLQNCCTELNIENFLKLLNKHWKNINKLKTLDI